MNSLEIREFSQSIINFINQNPLPIEVKRLALKDILAQTEKETDRILAEEIECRETANTHAESEVEE